MSSNQSVKYKKFVVAAASAALVASALAPMASAKEFSDTKGNTHEVAIDALSDAGVITGNLDGSFLPNKTLTRSDVVKLMGKWLVTQDYKVPTDYKTNMRFSDLTSASNDELLQYAAIVKDNGVFNGSDGRLLAGDKITRENMAVVIVRAFDKVNDIDLVKYVAAQDFKKDVTDLGKAKAEARPAINVLDFFDITNPAAPAFNPKNTTSRGQFATFLYKTINADFSAVKAPNVDQVAVDAAAEQVKAGAVTVARGNYATDANKLAAVQTYVTSLVTEKDVVSTVVAGKTAGEYAVTLTKGEAKAEKTIAMTFDFAAEDLNVTKVESITKTSVKVTLKALAQNETAFTINVLDDKGNVVEVNPVSLEKGETEATFTFKTPLTVDPTGVWVVGAVKYDNDAIKNYNDIVAAAATNNEVTTLAAIKKAGLTNVVDANITAYVTAINAAATKEKLADIQVIIDKANDTTVSAGEAAAAVKAVNDATNQVQLLSALQHKAFAHVNASWIVDYNTAITTAKATAANTDTIAEIQSLVNTQNTNKINAANTAAASVADQNTVTELIKLYTVADVAPATTKAAAVKASQVKSAVFGVKEATTAATVYNALVKVSELDSVNLPATALNANLKAEYLTAKNAATITGATTVSDLKTTVVTVADAASLSSAADAIEALTATSTAVEVKAALQKLADVTSHAAVKFDLTKVSDASLLDYRAALEALAKTAVDTAAEVNTIIAGVNGTNNATVNLATIKDTSATVAQVRDALTEIAASATSNVVTQAYIDASSQVKLEVAQLIIDNRSELAANLTADLVINIAGTPNYADAVLKTAMTEHAAKIANFNAIGDLAAATITTTKEALNDFAYPAYAGLTETQKIAVAEEVNKLTKTVNLVVSSLNFATVDKVTTIKQANDYVAAAVTKVTGK